MNCRLSMWTIACVGFCAGAALAQKLKKSQMLRMEENSHTCAPMCTFPAHSANINNLAATLMMPRHACHITASWLGDNAWG